MLKLFVLFSFSFSVWGSELIGYKGNPYKAIINYNKVHSSFFKHACSKREDRTYLKLLKEYRGQGYYLPKINNEIDRKAIKKHLHKYQKKANYISSVLSRVKKSKFPKYKILVADLGQSLDNLLRLKKEYHLELLDFNKEKIRKQSETELVVFKKRFKFFLNQIYFLKSFNFPNDYLSTRRDYEKYKDTNKKKSNQIYFYRRIVEDGAFDPDHTRSDKFLRTTLDTLYLNIKKEEGFLSENIRYDLEWVLSGVKNILRRGKKVQIARLGEWLKRTKETHEFYNDIIGSKSRKKAKALVAKENEASIALKDFVYKNQARTYEFWAKQSEINKALFALETILYNEVGVLDAPYGLERLEVAQVVIKRYLDSFYSQLSPKQPLMTFLDSKINHKNEKWLNVLFRVGEFSFTYHYISAVSHIFCPDMSKRGKRIRNTNLKLSLKALKNYSKDYEALRYFSRISMLGKIDMSSVWTDYKKLPEAPGHKAIEQRRLTRLYLADKYRYLYTFLDKKRVEYTVIQMGKKIYSLRWIKGRPVFFDYRNPQLFSYFKKID